MVATFVYGMGIEQFSPQYKDRVYRIAHPLGWMLIVSSPKYIDELKRTPDDKLSFDDGTREVS